MKKKGNIHIEITGIGKDVSAEDTASCIKRALNMIGIKDAHLLIDDGEEFISTQEIKHDRE